MQKCGSQTATRQKTLDVGLGTRVATRDITPNLGRDEGLSGQNRLKNIQKEPKLEARMVKNCLRKLRQQGETRLTSCQPVISVASQL